MESPEVQRNNDDGMSEEENDRGISNRDDEAQEAPGPPPPGEPIKPKRIIKNPQPKLDAVRLMGPRGIGILPSTFKEVKFKGKGHEREDLNLLMKKLEHWAHRLYPKLTFDDTLKQIEKLGSKKPVQNLVRRIRLDMYQADEMTVENKNNLNEDANIADEVDVFDELLGTGPFASQTSSTQSRFISNIGPVMSQTERPAISHSAMSLTEEQKERIERNKLLAAERRKAKMLEQSLLESLDLSATSQVPNNSLDVNQEINMPPLTQLNESTINVVEEVNLNIGANIILPSNHLNSAELTDMDADVSGLAEGDTQSSINQIESLGLSPQVCAAQSLQQMNTKICETKIDLIQQTNDNVGDAEMNLVETVSPIKMDISVNDSTSQQPVTEHVCTEDEVLAFLDE